MNSSRRIALVAGIFFAITYIGLDPGASSVRPCSERPQLHRRRGRRHAGVLGRVLRNHPRHRQRRNSRHAVPILKRQNEGVALGYVAVRVLESTIIVVGLVSLLSVVTLREDLAGASGTDSGSLVVAGKSLVALRTGRFSSRPPSAPTWALASCWAT
jgi:hypothetical protein